MTVLAKDRKTDQFGSPDEVEPRLIDFPVAAATSLYGGAIVATDASGNAVPGSASTALKIWGRCEQQQINTVAAGFGTAGDLTVTVRRGVFFLASGAGVDAIGDDDVGKLCYVIDDQTVGLTDGAGLRPAAGVVYNIRDDGQVGVGLGFTSLYDVDDELFPTIATRVLTVRNVVTSNISDLTSYTVAANQGVNDDTLGVAGDVLALLGQSTAEQNGLYVIGTVTAGVAPLTRSSALPVGYVFDESAIMLRVSEGAKFVGASLINRAAGTLGTNDPVFRVEIAPVVQLKTFRVRNVLNANVADLTAYTVASNSANNDATLNVENDLVLLIAQTTASQNGIYAVGTVTAGVAPLTRLASMPSGYAFLADEFEIAVSAGTLFQHTKWFNSAAGTIGTDAPAFFPRSVTQSVALVAGTTTITNVPILSATKSGFSVRRSTANTSTLTVGGYVLNGNPTPGALGTATAEIMAAVAAGTINNADISTLHITITNP